VIIVVPSIPHTGTNFVWKVVLKDLEPEIRNPRKFNHGKIWIHTYPERIPELLTLKAYPWVVPMRHPYEVAKTWKGRKKDLGYLKMLYDIHLSSVAPNKPYYVVVDGPNRDRQLQAVNRLTGFNVETDWHKEASLGHSEELTEGEKQLLEPYLTFYAEICSPSELD